MKNLMLIIFALGIAGWANAQKVSEADLPQPVKAAMQKQFPNAQKVVWGKEGTDFEAEFMNKGEETSAVFNPVGILKETEVEIKVSALPSAVRDYCTTNYPGYKISEAAKMINPAGDITYEAELSKGKDKFDAVFDAKGAFLKKVVVPTGEDKD